MVKKERPRLPTSGEGASNALDRWDEEGGAQAGLWPLPYETGVLLEPERRVLVCLGAALVSEWNGLPNDVQRRLFERATSGKRTATIGESVVTDSDVGTCRPRKLSKKSEFGS